MSESRLSLCLDEAGGLPPAGPILVLRPSQAADLSALPRDRVNIVTGFRPDHDAFAARGYKVTADLEGLCAAGILFLPRSKSFARALVAFAMDHLPQGAPLWIDGQKTDGIEPLWKDLRGRCDQIAAVTKSHGRCFAVRADAAAVADWRAAPSEPVPGFITRPGVFSADGVDAGSTLLAAHLPHDLKGKGADLGAGWGWLAAQTLANPGVKLLHLVEAEAEALACARQNVPDERAAFHWADATTFAPGHTLDFVVMNPPFHTGRAAEPALGAAFIRAAARLLHPQGRLYMVANRTLPYEEALAASFRQVTPIATDGGFKLFVASHPLKRHADRA
jgi:16S rRNA (guanine1207-N2)-methyltransferase